MMLRFFVSLLSGFTSYPPEYILAVPFPLSCHVSVLSSAYFFLAMYQHFL